MIQLISYKMHNPPPFSPGFGTDVGGVKVFFLRIVHIYTEYLLSTSTVIVLRSYTNMLILA